MLTEAKRIANHDRVVELLNSVDRDGISDLLKWLEESDFYTAPASHAYHGSYIGGLVQIFMVILPVWIIRFRNCQIRCCGGRTS